MTIRVQLVTIVDSIAEIQVEGVNVRDAAHIPENAIDSCPVFFPAPDGFVTSPTFTAQSFGADDQRKMDLSYTLKYRLLYAPLGSGAFLANYAGTLEKVGLILEAILGTSTPEGAVDMSLQDLKLDAMTDPAGAIQYHGAEITLRVLEFAQ
jgi:hypothetical protein